MTLDVDRIPFGLASITIGEGKDAVSFDGVDEFQAEGGEVSLSPILEDITVADFGNGVYDQRIVGHEGSVTFVAAQESVRVLELALSFADSITATEDGKTVGLTDSPIGSSIRKRGKKVTIHPRTLPKSDTSMDITIYKMVSNEGFTRGQANEQGNIPITLNMLPRDGMDPTKPGNFYYIGGTDPNADVVPGP